MVSRNYAKEVEAEGHSIHCNYEVDAFDDIGGDFPIAVKAKVAEGHKIYSFVKDKFAQWLGEYIRFLHKVSEETSDC